MYPWLTLSQKSALYYTLTAMLKGKQFVFLRKSFQMPHLHVIWYPLQTFSIKILGHRVPWSYSSPPFVLHPHEDPSVKVALLIDTGSGLTRTKNSVKLDCDD